MKTERVFIRLLIVFSLAGFFRTKPDTWAVEKTETGLRHRAATKSHKQLPHQI